MQSLFHQHLYGLFKQSNILCSSYFRYQNILTLNFSYINKYFTLYGLELELRDWRIKFAPCAYNILDESGLQFDVNIGKFAFINVERSIPLRDQIFIDPSWPATIKTILLKTNNL